MSTAKAPPRLRLIDWLSPRQRWVALPSWLVSLLIHATALFVLVQIANHQPRRPDIAGEGGDSFREVGIYTGDPGGSGDGGDGSPTPGAAIDVPSAVPMGQASDLTEALPDGPPIPLSLPDVSGPPVIGAGGLAGASGAPQVGSPFGERLLKPVGGGGGTGTGRPGSGGGTGTGIGRGTGRTALFGVGDGGKRFVYVIDRSGSMADNDAFYAAQSELIASIERLDEKQQFQVIFYNHLPLALTTRDQRFPMFFGTDTQRLQVIEQIRAIEPRDGTQHMPALAAALKYEPDVIFFLTDGTEPSLSALELAEIKRRNSNGAHIHCIEFGEGPESKVNRTGNFLVKIAEANQGQYVYRDVTKFKRP
jgi:hypothetical protein